MKNCDEYRSTFAHHKDSHARQFLALEKKMARMSHDVSAQRAETEHLNTAVCCLADQNWSQGQDLARKDQRIKELKEEMLAVKVGLEDQRVNHCDLNITVVEVQEWVKDLESCIEWINKLHNTHSKSLDNFSICLDNAEETLEEFKGNWRKYDQDQKWNGMMTHLNSQRHYILQRKLDIVSIQVEDIEEALMREIHCSHCLCGSREPIGSPPHEPSGWNPWYQSDYWVSEIDV